MSLPEITDEDRAVAEEAYRLYDASGYPGPPGEIAAALVRTGWKPVDPDLILAREVCAAQNPITATTRDQYLAGQHDGSGSITLALAAIKAVRREGERKG